MRDIVVYTTLFCGYRELQALDAAGRLDAMPQALPAGPMAGDP